MAGLRITGRSFIAGNPGSTDGEPFHAYDPGSAHYLKPTFYQASEAEAARAIDAAEHAFEDYARRAAESRADLLEAIAGEIEALGDALVERASAETGLPAARITGERGRTCGQLRSFAALVREGSWVDASIDTALPDRKPSPRPDIRRMLRPIGPVAVFGASNFPLAFSTAGGDTASALAAGCPVVVKAHPAHPGTGELVAGAIARAIEGRGLPAGAFSFVHGGPAIGAALVSHPLTRAVGFTGSQAAGRALFDVAARRPDPIPVFAEMSSLNPVFLLPGVIRRRGAAIAEGLVGSFTLGVGQFCTKPGLVFALRGPDTDAFLGELSGAVRKSGPATMLSAGILDAFLKSRDRVRGVDGVEDIAESASPVEGGETRAASSVAKVDATTFLEHPELVTEAFGPFTLVVEADDMNQLVTCARTMSGQLTATLHGTESDLGGAADLLAAAERFAGRLIINGFPTGVEVCAAMHHGGPYPATTDSRYTSVGAAAILRFARPVCYQGFADAQLPRELQDANPSGILRTVDGQRTRDPIVR
jgi:NADP-dependent aldehyde dehydrogenase